MLNKKLEILIKFFITFLLILGFYNSITQGMTWDERFHHENGLYRFLYLKSLGADLHYRNNMGLYPGLYDTIVYSISHIIYLINEKFLNNYIGEIRHIVNYAFSSLSLLGFYLLIKKVFNKFISLFAVLLALLNPFFFGHMGFNPKDVIIFFALVWFCYFFYNYIFEDNKNLNLIYLSVFFGFGLGSRPTFFVLLFPVVLSGLIYLIYTNQKDFIKKIFYKDIFISLVISISLMLLCWPQAVQGGLDFFISLIPQTIKFGAGPRLTLINGTFYETLNTPKMYFVYFFIYRMPIFLTALILFSYYLVFLKKTECFNEINSFKKKYLICNSIVFFPMLLAVILGQKLYGNIRLFLFILPFFSLLAAISTYFLFYNFNKNFNLTNIFTYLILILFFGFLYRFAMLNPYQYAYINYSFFNYKNTQGKFEHDYWQSSYKELVKKISLSNDFKNIKDLKIGRCGGDRFSLQVYLVKYLGLEKFYASSEADYLIMIDRASFNPHDKRTCFQKYPGKDLITVKRNGVIFSTFRKKIQDQSK